MWHTRKNLPLKIHLPFWRIFPLILAIFRRFWRLNGRQSVARMPIVVQECGMYRVFIRYCVFSWKFCYFSELCQYCCSAGVLPSWCVYTHWHREKTESGKYIKIFEKTQYLMNTLYLALWRISREMPHKAPVHIDGPRVENTFLNIIFNKQPVF